METKRRIAALIYMRDELVQKGMEMNRVLREIESPEIHIHVFMNKYISLVDLVNKEIARLKKIENIIDNWM